MSIRALTFSSVSEIVIYCQQITEHSELGGLSTVSRGVKTICPARDLAFPFGTYKAKTFAVVFGH
jgi:hypothetical protein